jgi:hypothetical protein
MDWHGKCVGMWRKAVGLNEKRGQRNVLSLLCVSFLPFLLSPKLLF